MEIPPNVTYKMFCGWPTGTNKNCVEEAVGEMPIYLDNNPKDGAGVIYIPICKIHLEGLDKHDET